MVVSWPATAPEENDSATGGRSAVTVHENDALVPTLPARSTARTSKLWAPDARSAYDSGLVHAENPECEEASSRHSKPATPEPVPSSPVNEKLAAVDPVEASGCPVIAAVGAVASMFTVSVAGAEGFPARSVATHDTACDPWPETSNVHGPVPESATPVPSRAQEGMPASDVVVSDAATVSVTGEDTFHPFEPSAWWDAV